MDARGNSFFLYCSTAETGQEQLHFVRIDVDGAIVWDTSYALSDRFVSVRSLNVNRFGELFVIYYQIDQAVLLRVNPKGTVDVEKPLDFGYAYLTTQFDTQGNLYLIVNRNEIRKLNREGNPVWSSVYRDKQNFRVRIRALEITPSGNVYGVVSSGWHSWSRQMVVKWRQVSEQQPSFSGPVRLEQNYPNPFNRSTIIDFTLSQSGPVELTIFNVLGQKVWQRKFGVLPAGHYWRRIDNWQRMASGQYYYQIKVNNAIQTRRMIYVK